MVVNRVIDEECTLSLIAVLFSDLGRGFVVTYVNCSGGSGGGCGCCCGCCC